MDATTAGIIAAGGGVFVTLVTIFLKLFRDLITKIIPDGFKLIRDQMQIAEDTADERHAEHIAHMTRIENTLERQERRGQRRNAARVKRAKKVTTRREVKPRKPRQS